MQKITGWPLLLLRIRIILLLLALPIVFLLALYVGMVGVAAVSDHQDVPAAGALAEEATCETATPESSRGGLLLSIPQGLIGNWVVRTGHEQCQILNVINLDILDGGLLQLLQNGLPASNTWVYAKVELQIGGLAVVTEIRLHNYEPGEVVARLQEGVPPSTIASRYNINPEATLLSSGNIHLFTTPQKDDDVKALVTQMALDEDIIWAELNYRGEAPEANPYRTWAWGGPEPTSYVNQLAFEQVNLPPALEHYQGDGIVVAVLDTGVDLTHPALVGRLAPGIDLVADDNDPQDEGPGMGWGHGTHIAGIIARMAPNSILLPVRVLDAEGQGNVFKLAYAIDWIVQEWVVQQDADVVINLSLGIEEETETLAHVLAEAQAAGVIIVAAAGNDNSNEVQYPIGYEGVIGVTALATGTQKADFANYGPWVDLAAPGVGITSTIIGPEGSGYASWRGTSMATAFVSGAAALARQKYPMSSTAEIATLLISTASGLDDANPAYVGQLGRLLDTGAAVVNQPSPTPTATPTPVTPSQSPTPATSPTETPTPGTTPGGTQTPVTPVESSTPGGTQTPVGTTTPVATPTPTSDTPGGQSNMLYLPLVRN